MKTTTWKAGALVALTLAGAVAASSPASAQYYYRGYHGGISPGGAAAIGAIGGLALGAAIASRPAYGYGYGYGEPAYAAPPVYYAPAPVYYAPRPVYVAPRPVVYARPYYPRYAAYGPWPHRHYGYGPGWGYGGYRNW
jgi:hypothetical protein